MFGGYERGLNGERQEVTFTVRAERLPQRAQQSLPPLDTPLLQLGNGQYMQPDIPPIPQPETRSADDAQVLFRSGSLGSETEPESLHDEVKHPPVSVGQLEHARVDWILPRQLCAICGSRKAVRQPRFTSCPPMTQQKHYYRQDIQDSQAPESPWMPTRRSYTPAQRDFTPPLPSSPNGFAGSGLEEDEYPLSATPERLRGSPGGPSRHRHNASKFEGASHDA